MIHADADGYRLAFEGLKVFQCVVDTRLGLRLGRTNVEAEIYINGPLTLSSPEFGSLAIDFFKEPERLSPVLSFCRGTVVRMCRAAHDGALDLEFEHSQRIRVAPHADYEAWELVAHNERLICNPGGGVSHFGRPEAQVTRPAPRTPVH
jgi:hypothetical protein